MCGLCYNYTAAHLFLSTKRQESSVICQHETWSQLCITNKDKCEINWKNFFVCWFLKSDIFVFSTPYVVKVESHYRRCLLHRPTNYTPSLNNKMKVKIWLWTFKEIFVKCCKLFFPLKNHKGRPMLKDIRENSPMAYMRTIRKK